MQPRKFRILSAIIVVSGMMAAALGWTPASAETSSASDNRAPTALGEITAYYEHRLNRAPDPAGLAQYMAFANKDCLWGVQSAGFQILNSAEALAAWQNNPQTLAGMLYAALLNRAPDPGGLATYTARHRAARPGLVNRVHDGIRRVPQPPGGHLSEPE